MKSIHNYAIIVVILSSLVFQSFQCASPEFTGAKMAYAQKDYKKAAEALEKEVVKNPTNAEAWYLLSDCNLKQSNYAKAAEYSLEAQKKASTDILKNKVADQLFYIWAEAYNKGTNFYNDFISSDKSKDITEMVDILNLAMTLKPENSEPLALIGNVYELTGDTAKAIITYERYITQLAAAFDIMKERSVTLGMPREEAISLLGKPLSTKSIPENNGDSLISDKLIVNGKEIFVSSVKKAGNRSLVEGIRVNLPANWLAIERERFFSINISPLVSLAYLHYGHRNFTKTLEVIETVLAVNPGDEELSSLKIQVYEDQGRTDEVLKSLDIAATKNPNNKIYLEQYARVLARQKKYDLAISYYEKSLGVDPKFEVAIFNIGACYVNQAAEVIDSENKKVDANAKYKPDESKFFTLLNKAADYFSQYRSNPINKENLGVLQQLADIYIITRQNDKFKTTVSELEKAEPANLTNPIYYEYMGKVYAKQGLKDKADKAFGMSDMLKKK